MQINKTLRFLYSLENKGMKLGLERTFELLKVLGNPQNNFKSIHVAGTNGKGSTTAFIASILMEAGFKVGIYTSPHLINFNERIKINGKLISNKFLIDSTKILKPTILKINPTFFEVTTAICLFYFSEMKIDIAVIETGLGGRLDATNVVKPIISAITKIDFDHTEILGNSLKLIAKEKGGIIKNEIPIVLSKNNDVVKKTINRIAAEHNSDFYFANKLNYNFKKIPLTGLYQKDNLATALSVMSILKNKYKINITKNNLFSGVKNVIKNTNFHARYEVVNKKPKIICDVAHNLDAINNIILNLKDEKFKNLFVIFGVMKDKNYELMINELQMVSSEFYFVEADTNRTLKYNSIKNIFKNVKFLKLNHKSIDQLLSKLDLKNDLLLVTGSHLVVGEFLKIYKKRLDKIPKYI